MKNVKIYKCPVCGNTVLKLSDGSENLTCCGQTMQLLKANGTDGAKEKHVPFIKEELKKCDVNNCSISNVQVGEVEHPMTKEHGINGIGSFSDKTWTIKGLNPGDKPQRKLKVSDQITLYEYCNLHGLWKKEIK